MGKRKRKYVSSEISPLDANPTFRKWRTEKLWWSPSCFTRCNLKLPNSYFFLKTTKEIWDSSEKTYFGVDKLARVYELLQIV